MTLLYKTDEHSKPSICPRHPPIGRTRYPLVLPPELLISILLDIRSEYLCYLFLSETRDEEEVEERLAANPFPAILHVSQQFRRIAFSIVEAFGAYRDPEGWYEAARSPSYSLSVFTLCTDTYPAVACPRTHGAAFAIS